MPLDNMNSNLSKKEMPSRPENKKFGGFLEYLDNIRMPIKHALVILFFISNIIFFGGIILYNKNQSEVLAYKYKAQTISGAADNVREQVDRVFTPVMDLAGRASAFAWSSLGEPFPIDSLIGVAQIMDANPQISSVYFADAEDEFVQISTVFSGSLFENGRLAPPSGAKFAMRHMRGPHHTARRVVWSFLDDRMQLMGQPVHLNNIYDPTQRPWYKAALASDATVVSKPYPFLSVDSVGITASRRVDGWGGGVFGIDLTFETLSKALRRYVDQDNTTAIMFTENGEIVASLNTFDSRGSDATVDGIRDSVRQDPVANTLFSLATKGKMDNIRISPAEDQQFVTPDGSPVSESGLFVFDVKDRAYAGKIILLDNHFSTRTFLAFAIARDELMGDVDAMFVNSFLMSMVFLVGIIIVTWVIARAMSLPISDLASEARRIRRFELDSPVNVRSHFSELHELGSSVAAMKSSLIAFGRYIPRVIVRKMILDGKFPELGGDQREVTVMFTDVANFTALSELVPPHDLMRKLSAYLECYSRQIINHGGIVDKFIGDAVMAVWNSFGDVPDHAHRACLAALCCRAANDKLNNDWRSFGWPEMHTRIGLHMGDAIVGNIGSSDRMEHTTIGATVNTAARMEGLNKKYGTRILVSKTVYDRVEDDFLMRPIDFVTPKGSVSRIQVYELIGSREDQGAVTISPDDIRFCDLWQPIYDSYHAGRWQQAIDALTDFIDLYPSDSVARAYLEKARSFVDMSPVVN